MNFEPDIDGVPAEKTINFLLDKVKDREEKLSKALKMLEEVNNQLEFVTLVKIKNTLRECKCG